MSTTSQKHRNFVAEPMGDKPVTELAGVGEVLGKRLEAAGFDRVIFVLLIKYLIINILHCNEDTCFILYIQQYYLRMYKNIKLF